MLGESNVEFLNLGAIDILSLMILGCGVILDVVGGSAASWAFSPLEPSGTLSVGTTRTVSRHCQIPVVGKLPLD